MNEIKTGQDVMEEAKARAENISNIRNRFPDVDFPSPVLEPMYYGRFEKKPVEARKLVIDKPTGRQFDIVSDDYVLVHHEEVVKSVLDACPAEFGDPEFKIRMIMDGARAIVEAKFPSMGNFMVNGSQIDPMIRMINSINRSTHLVFEFGAYEQVCTNGLIAFKALESNKFRHITGSLDRMTLNETMNTALLDFSEQHQIWNQWAETQLDAIEVQEVVGSLPFSENEQKAMMDLKLLNHGGATLGKFTKEGKSTLWTVNSAATQFAKHEIRSEKRQVELEPQIAKIMHKYNA